MNGYLKAVCILLAFGFLLFLAGSVAFEAQMPIIGTILEVVGILSFFSIPWVLWRERRKEKEEESRWLD